MGNAHAHVCEVSMTGCVQWASNAGPTGGSELSMSDDFADLVRNMRSADERKADLASREASERQSAWERNKKLFNKLAQIASALARSLELARAPVDIRISDSTTSQRRGLFGGKRWETVEHLAIEGWKFNDTLRSFHDSDSGRTSESAQGYLVGVDGELYRYNFSDLRYSTEFRNAWLWNYAEEWSDAMLNGPVEAGSIHVEYESIRSGLARLVIAHDLNFTGVERNGA